LYFTRDLDRDKHLRSLTGLEIEETKIVYGHQAYFGIHKLFGKEGRYITFFRNPRDRSMSHYNYCKLQYLKFGEFCSPNILSKSGNILSFEEWFIKSEYILSNYLVRKILSFYYNKPIVSQAKEISGDHLKEAKRVLHEFYFVGITEQFKEDACFISRILGMPVTYRSMNITKEKYISKRDPAVDRIMKEKSGLELDLYEYALALNKRFKQSEKTNACSWDLREGR
ncbi:hypothetical protein ACFL42_04845, partial [Candidatus Omnitrophota bacterium]